MKKWILLGVGCIWFSGCVTMDMAGRIVDKDTTEGVPKIAVTLKDNNGIELGLFETDDKGDFIIHKVKKGTYQLAYHKNGVVMPETKTIDLNTLSKKGAESLRYEVAVETAVQGKIVDKETNEPVEQAVVRLAKIDTDEMNVGDSGVDGEYVFEYIEPDKYKILVERGNYQWIETPLFTIAKGKVAVFDNIMLVKCPDVEINILPGESKYETYGLTIDGQSIIDNSTIR